MGITALLSGRFQPTNAYPSNVRFPRPPTSQTTLGLWAISHQPYRSGCCPATSNSKSSRRDAPSYAGTIKLRLATLHYHYTTPHRRTASTAQHQRFQGPLHPHGAHANNVLQTAMTLAATTTANACNYLCFFSRRIHLEPLQVTLRIHGSRP